MPKIRKKEALDYHEQGRPGKLEVIPSKPTASQRDLALAYSPGVAEPCLEIAEHPEDVYRYTGKGNLVAVISNGTAVLGLGNIGPAASKPVMEGKGVLFKIFADIDVFDIEVDASDVDRFVDTVKAIAPTFGGINLEDIKAPEAFEIEERLKAELNIPIMHDDQHGTAIIGSAALLNALELTEKEIIYSYEIWRRAFTAYPEAFIWSPLCEHIQAKIFNYLKEHLRGAPLRYLSSLSIENQTRGSHALHLIRKEYGFTSPLQMLTVLLDAQRPTIQQPGQSFGEYYTVFNVRNDMLDELFPDPVLRQKMLKAAKLIEGAQSRYAEAITKLVKKACKAIIDTGMAPMIEEKEIEKELRAQDDELKIQKVFNPRSHRVERKAMAVDMTDAPSGPAGPVSPTSGSESR